MLLYSKEFIAASGCTTINWVNIDAGLKDRLKNLQLVISLLIDIRSSLRRVIDCNSYLQRTNDLFQNYRSVQSKLVMYTSIKAAFKKLQARLDLKQNDCKYCKFKTNFCLLFYFIRFYVFIIFNFLFFQAVF